MNAVCCVYGSSSRLVLLLVFDAAAEAEEAEQEAFGVCEFVCLCVHFVIVANCLPELPFVPSEFGVRGWGSTE